MPRTEIKSASLKEAVRFHGAADQTMQNEKDAKVYFDTDLQCVVGVSDKWPDGILVPMSNVKYMFQMGEVELNRRAAERTQASVAKEEAAKALEARKSADAERTSQNVAARPDAKRNTRGITKFVKDPVTGKIEEKII